MVKRNLEVSIKNLLKRFNKTTFYQPLFETIINALDANATNIDIEVIKIKNGDKYKIDGFIVKDNGDGFTEQNVNSYLKLYDEKPNKGKLGSGRFMSLVVFKSLFVESQLTNKTVKIKLSRDNDAIEYNEEQTFNSEKFTKVMFSNVNNDFNREVPYFDLNALKIKIEDYLLPRLSFMIANKIDFNISIDNMLFIDKKSIMPLNVEGFDIPYNNTNGKEHFDLYYNISKNIPENSCYYVAHNRKVKSFTKDANPVGVLPDDNKMILILASKYFDKHISDNRNDFDIDLNNTSDEAPISLTSINKSLIDKYKSIIINKFPQIIENDNKIKEDCINERPYLQKYIKKDNTFLMSKNMVFDKAEKKYEEERKKSIRDYEKILKNKIGSDEEFEKIWGEIEDIATRDLGRYIVYRQQIIDYLKILNSNNERIEKFLHNLLIKKQDVVSDTDDIMLKQNLWLLDDKFMSFSKCCSDKTFNEIKQIIEKNRISQKDGGSLRPDILAVYLSNTEEHENIDCVILELKGIGTSDDEKRKSISELAENVVVLREHFPNIRNIYSIIITNIDDRFRKTLSGLDFTPCLENSSSDVEYYYNFYKNNKTHCYVMSTNIIAKNADMRNKVFMNILKQKCNPK